MGNEKIYQMDFSKVYHLLVNKAERKGRTRKEVDEMIRWLTGYSQPELEGMLERPSGYECWPPISTPVLKIMCRRKRKSAACLYTRTIIRSIKICWIS